jgi:hypothetical protein
LKAARRVYFYRSCLRGARSADQRLPKGKEAREEYLRTVGADGLRLLGQLDAPYTSRSLKELAEVEILRQIWEQYYDASDGQIRVLDPKEMPEGARRIESPYEVEKSLLASTLIGRASRELSRKGFEPSGCARSATGAWENPPPRTGHCDGG